jgi:hypothetical protein
VSVLQYRDDGFLPEGLLNYLGRLGWSHGDQEIFSIEEMTQYFDINDVNKSASALNLDKMLWTNQQHILRATPERLAKYLQPQLAALGIETDDWAKMAAVAKAQQERAKTLKEMAQNSVYFFRDVTSYDEKAAKKNLTGGQGSARRDARVGRARDPRRHHRRGGGAGRRTRSRGATRSRGGCGRLGVAADRRHARDPWPRGNARAARSRGRLRARLTAAGAHQPQNSRAPMSIAATRWRGRPEAGCTYSNSGHSETPSTEPGSPPASIRASRA